MAGPKPDDPYVPVQTVNPTIGLPNDYRQVEVTPGAFGGQVGEAESKFGATAGELADKSSELALQFQQVQNESTANSAVKDYALFASNSEMQLREKQGQNAVDALPAYQKAMSDKYDEMANNIQSPLAKQMFQQDARNFYDRSLYGAGLYVGDEAKKGLLVSDHGRIQASNDFTTLHFDDPKAVAQGVSDITNMSLLLAQHQGITDPDAVHAMTSDNVGKMLTSVITAQSAQGTTLQQQVASNQAAQKMLQQWKNQSIPGSPGVPLLSAKYQDELSQKLNYRDMLLQSKVDRQQDKYEASQRTAISNQVENSMSMLEHGVAIPNGFLPSESAVRSAYSKNPEMAQLQVDRLQDLQATNRFMGLVPGMTPQQVTDLKQSVQPDASRPETYARQARLSSALDRTLDVRARQITKDSAGYIVSTNPEIGQMLKDSDQNPQTFPSYVHALQTEQETMQVPLAMRHVLPIEVAQGLAAKIQQDPSSLAGYQKSYGSYWPSVFRDVVQQGKLPAGYQAVGVLNSNNNTAGDGELLSRVISDRSNDKAVEKLLDRKTDSAIKSSVAGQLTPLINTYKAQGMPPAQVEDIVKSATDLAYGYNYYKQQTPSAAVTSAVSAFTRNHSFYGSARIPADKASTVSANAGTTLRGLSPSNIAIPPGLGVSPGGPTADEYIGWVKASPTWTTNPSGNALRLQDPAGRYVMDHKGRPLEVPFDSPLINPPQLESGQGISQTNPLFEK